MVLNQALYMSHRILCGFLLILCTLLLPLASWGQLLIQNFSSSATVSDYVNASPNNTQFTSITASTGSTVSIVGERLEFARATGGEGWFSRSTSFSTVPTTLMVQFSLEIINTGGAQTTACLVKVGNGLNDVGTPLDVNANIFARFGINYTATAGQFSIRNIDAGTNSGNFTGKQTITFVMNKSGSDLVYVAPTGTNRTLATDRYDVYVGTTLVQNAVAALTPSVDLANFKFNFRPSNNGASLRIDNIYVNSLNGTGNLSSGTYTLGSSTGNFTSITAPGGLFNVLNNLGSIATGGYTFAIKEDLTETGENPLFQVSGMSSSNLIKIQPDGTTERLIVGNVNANGGMIRLDGADYVIFDGRDPGTNTGKFLRFRNTNNANSANNSTFTLLNGATNNVLQHCFIEGAATGASGNTNGGVIRITTSSSGGNNNNSILSNHIRNSSAVGASTAGTAIFINGSASPNQNDGNVIRDNDIYNFFVNNNGNQNTLSIQGNTTNLIIAENHFYQTTNYISGPGSTRAVLIRVQGDGNNNINITDNFFGGKGRNCSGGYMTYDMGNTDQPITFRGAIRVTTQTGLIINIERNTIRNIEVFTRKNTNCNEIGMAMIQAEGGVVNIRNNNIGSTIDNTSLKITQQIARTGFCAGGANSCEEFMTIQLLNYTAEGGGVIENNRIGGVSCEINADQNFPVFNVIGMRLAPASAGLIVRNNTIGSTTHTDNIQVRHINATSGSTNAVRAVLLMGMNALSLINNTIANISNYSTGSVVPNNINCASNNGVNFYSLLYGIDQQAAASNTITNNTIAHIRGSGIVPISLDEVSTAAIRIAAAATVTIASNTIHNIRAAAAAQTTAAGILLTADVNGQVRNNRIYNIRNSAPGNSVAAGLLLRNVGNTLYIFNNMISLGTSATDNTHYIGIWNNAASANPIRCWYNTVYIGGDGTGTSLPSFGYLRGDFDGATNFAAMPQLINTIFYNTRTGGTGGHYAIGNQENSVWANGAPCDSESLPNFNAYYTTAGAQIGQWLGSDRDFANWRSSAGNPDANSFFLTQVLNFADPATGDLHVTPNSNFAQTVDGKGSPIHTITNFLIDVDYDFDGEFRRSPDIGADEVENTIIATASGGDWHNPSTWVQNVVPNCGDLVEIPNGVTVTIKTPGTGAGSNSSVTADSVGVVAKFYQLTIKTGGTLILENGARAESCWLNGTVPSSINTMQTHTGNLLIETGGLVQVADNHSYRLSLAGDFTNNGNFVPGKGTVEMNLDRPRVNNCYAQYIEWFNRAFAESDINGTAAFTRFHNLTVLSHTNNLATSPIVNAPAGSTTITGSGRMIMVGNVTDKDGVLNIQGTVLGSGGRLNLNGNRLIIEGTIASDGHTSIHPNVATLSPPAVGTQGTISGQGGRLHIFGTGNLTGMLKFTLPTYTNLPTVTNGQDFTHLLMNRPTNGLATLGNGTVNISQELDLTAGRIQTDAFEVNVTNASPAAVINYKSNAAQYNEGISSQSWSGAAPASWVWGNLRRAIDNMAATYDFPVGDGTRYELARLVITSPFGSGRSILGRFNPTNSSATINESCTMPYLPCLGGSWTLTPSAALTGGATYDMQLFPIGFTCNVPSGVVCPTPVTIAKSNPYKFHGSTFASMFRRNGFTTFSDFVPVFSDNLLPVTLISFEAQKSGTREALIRWVTAREINVSHFEVQRSTNGSQWINIGKVSAQGNSIQGKEYSFTDREPRPVTNYYRLRIVDTNDTYAFTRIESLTFDENLRQERILIYPNPTASEKITMLLLLPSAVAYRAEISDATGRVLYSAESVWTGGSTEISLQNLAKGWYLLRIIAGSHVWTEKIAIE